MRTTIALCGVGVLWLAHPVSAQQSGTFEVGAFGQDTRFDNSLGLDDAIGGGGLLGIYFTNNLAVEGEGSYTSTSQGTTTGVSFVPIRARLLFSPHIFNQLALLFGAGYVHADYGNTNPSDDGVTGLAGLRYEFGKKYTVGIRLDYVGDYIPSPPNGASSNFNGTVQAGVSLLFHRQVPKDLDKDGVLDGADQCPNTPMGDAVYADGCSLPKDSDGDGVVDFSDRCPNTPRGTAVDSTGCADTDHDGVPDPADLCPNTPAGQTVDRFGCTADSDGDGVENSRDQCPDTPGGQAVDTRGCAIVSVFRPGTTALVLEGVNFQTGKATLIEASRDTLDRVYRIPKSRLSEIKKELASVGDHPAAPRDNVAASS